MKKIYVTPTEIIAWLEKAPIFSSLDSTELEIVAKASDFAEFDQTEMLFRQGDKGSHCYIVVKSSIDILKKDESAVDQPDSLIAQLLPGDSFGELELLTGAVHNASAKPTDTVRIVVFPSSKITLADFFEKNPVISAKMLFSYQKSTAGRLRQALSIIKENSPFVQELKKQDYSTRPILKNSFPNW
jgi:CRP/FNR family cyclic AMP-dependent transcriptional regulator